MINNDFCLQMTSHCLKIKLKNAKMSLIFKRLKITGYFVLLIFACTSCKTDNKSDLPYLEFYFPVNDLSESKVYRYKSTNDSLGDQIWVLKADRSSNNTFLNGAIFQMDGLLTHRWKEEQTSTGQVMLEYALALNNDSTQPLLKTEIIQDDIFPFAADKNGIFLFDMKWKDPGNSKVSYELIRNRIFAGDTMITVRGKKMKTIHFKVKERVEVDDEGILGLDLSGDEFYGEGVGLVVFIKNLDEKNRVVYELDTILEGKEYLKTLKIKDPFQGK